MTSGSSDGYEILERRRVYVGGISAATLNSEIQDHFSKFGSISSFIHNSRKGFAFLTFDEEYQASRAIKEMNGTEFQGRILKVEYSHSHTLPVTGVRRLVKFPKPFGGRGGASSSSSNSRRQFSNGNTSSYMFGSFNSRTNRSGKASRNGASQWIPGSNENKTVGRHHSKPARCVSSFGMTSHVRVWHCEPFKKTSTHRNDEELKAKYQSIFMIDLYSEVVRRIFFSLDAVTLLKCKLVCKTWRNSIDALISPTTKFGKILQMRWKSSDCSFYPIHPNMYETGKKHNFLKHNIASSYRNILSLKCDTEEIVLAVDNGNVEIYDRATLKLKTVLIGQNNYSPSIIDMNQAILFVGYRVGFGKSYRKYVTCWNIFDRKTKALIRTIEHDSDVIQIGFDNNLIFSTDSGIYSVRNYENTDNVSFCKIYSVHESDKIEVWDIDTACDMLIAAVRHADRNKSLMFHVWTKPKDAFDWSEEPVDFMTNLKVMFPILQDYARECPTFLVSKSKPLSIQLRYPMCLCLVSNDFGYFNHYENKGSPYTLFAFYDVAQEVCLRTILIDHTWMQNHNIVPFDYDSAILSARFNQDRLVIGFGSVSDKDDGGLAMFTMEEILNPDIENPRVFVLPAPRYHWQGWDGHTGGVHAIHLDELQLIAVNACVHQVFTKCIEGGEDSMKDNVLMYDFWRPGEDFRRHLKS